MVAEGEGVWKEYIGGYEYWERVKKSQSEALLKDTKDPKELKDNKDTLKPLAVATSVKAQEQTSDVTTSKPKKLSFKEQRELEQLPAQIAELEAEQANISERLADPALYRKQPEDVQKLNQRFAEIDQLLMKSLERWEAIEARARGS